MDLEKFESLKPEEQERIFHQSPFKEKGELLLHSHHPLRLARSLSQEELYLLAKEMDLQERSEVIRYASLPQLFFISDIDCWKKDRIHPRGFLSWLETLLAADENRLLAWITEMDYEAIVAGFKQLIQVLKPDREYAMDEILGDRPYFTLDDNYFIFAKEEDLETLRRTLELLFENNRGRYVSLLEGIMAELDDEVEEEAFQKKQMRLAERGFPEAETARQIYRLISKKEFEEFPLKNHRQTREKSVVVPNYPVLWSRDRFFFDEVLLLFEEDETPVREMIQEEIAWLSNKVIACDGIDFSSEERVREGIERVRAFVSVGLELLSGGDLVRSRQILTERWVEIIFRWGATHILQLREEGLEIPRIFWKADRGRFLGFLNDPYDSVFGGLLQTVPQYYDSSIENAERKRDFHSVQDIERSRRSIEQIKNAHEILSDHGLLFEIQALEADDPLLFSFLATLFVSHVLFGKSSLDSVDRPGLDRFLKEAFESRGEKRFLRADLKANFLSRISRVADRDIMLPLWALVFGELEEELGNLDLSKTVDLRYISSLRISKTGKKKKAKK